MQMNSILDLDEICKAEFRVQCEPVFMVFKTNKGLSFTQGVR